MEIYEKYEIICEQSSLDENVFNTFKSNPNYTTILEHVSYELGLQYYKKINDCNFNDYFFNKFMENDIIGGTKKFYYDDKFISPSTLRYIYTAYDINTKINIENLDIVEIGGGYGGQYKILNDMQEFFGRYFKSYTIIDLPSVIKLQSKYLNRLNYKNVNFISYNDLDKIENKYDACISNYGFGELDRNIQNNYVDKILKNCNNFYIIYNTQDVHNFLSDLKSEAEDPKTGQFNTLYYK